MATPPLKHRNGLIGTTIFHGLLLLLLFFMAFRTPLPLPEEQGIMVEFGTTSTGMGMVQPRMSDPAYTQPQPAPSPSAQQEAITQDYEESVALPAAPRQSETTRETVRETPRETATPVEQPREPERTPDQRALFPGRGDQSSTATSQGEAGGAGNQGVTTGTPNVHVYGEGIDVGGGLAGRGIAGTMPRPSYDVQVSGIVVVEVTVDRDGNVTAARAGVRGTTTSNSTLHEAALRAARQTKFARSNALQQTGTITYTFILQGE